MARKSATNAQVGSNSVNGVAVDRLRSFVERIERLNEEKKSLAADIKDIFDEAKSAGFDAKALRGLIAERKKEPSEMEEYLSLLALYRRALGMPDLDL